jgi:hypothetical protein
VGHLDGRSVLVEGKHLPRRVGRELGEEEADGGPVPREGAVGEQVAVDARLPLKQLIRAPPHRQRIGL